MKIDIICPLYNASKYIIDLNKSFLMQKNVLLNKIRYVLTESSDNTKEIMDNANI
ncbi:rhamnosyltransferase, partial [bacterium]|nr:rhamnosyltransferase [bacterium]